MKKDLENREDIMLLVNKFYEKVMIDDMIGFVFSNVMKFDANRHLSVMYDFWENALFFTGGYSGNPLEVHRRLNQHVPLRVEYFQRWTDLFLATVDELFRGEKAELAKQRALSIAVVMRVKILGEKF